MEDGDWDSEPEGGGGKETESKNGVIAPERPAGLSFGWMDQTRAFRFEIVVATVLRLVSVLA